MKALKVIILILLLLVALFLLTGLFLSKSAYTEQTIEIKAPVSVIFEQVNHLPNWEAWSPFQAEDPEMRIAYGEVLEGEGAYYTWESAKQGNGVIRIVESYTDSLVRYELEFVGQGKAKSDFRFAEKDGITQVTWSLGMDSLSYPLSRYFGLFLGSMMKPSFEKGLKKLKEISEGKEIPPVGRTGEIVEREVANQYILSIKDSCTTDEFEMFFEHSYATLIEFLSGHELQMTGSMMSIWHTWNPEGHSLVEAAVPVDQMINESLLEGRGILSRMLEGGNVVFASHFGSAESTGITHEALDAYMTEKGLLQRGESWEIYIAHKATEPDPAKWEIQVVYPLK